MANTQIASTATSVSFVFQDKNVSHAVRATYRKESIISISLLADRVLILTPAIEYHLSNRITKDTNVIDTVNGVSPSSLIDLYNKLAALL